MSDQEKRLSVLEQIGYITTLWAFFERQIDVSIWHLANIDDRLGACITSQVSSIHARFRILIALLRERGFEEDWIKKANKFAARAEKLIKKRNEYAHNPVILNENKISEIHHIKNDKALIFEKRQVSDEELWETLIAISQILDEFSGQILHPIVARTKRE